MKKNIIILLFLTLYVMAIENSESELLNFFKNNSIVLSKYTPSTTYYLSGTWESVDKDSLTIDNLGDISAMFISDNNVTKLPNSLSLLPNLFKLTIENISLDNFVKIESLKELQILNVTFKELPIEIFKNYNLTDLTIENSYIKEIPKEIGNLINLKTLNLNNNLLKILPSEIENISSLRILYLQNNLITTLPKEFDNLNLTHLDLSSNQIEDFNFSFPNLNSLSLSNNNITTIPNIGKSTSLSYLNLSSNNLKTLPDEVEKLVNLKELYLNDNKLEELPKGLGNICEAFESYKNYLRMPPPLTPCTIDVSNNRLSYLPRELGYIYGVGCKYDSSTQTSNLSFYFNDNFINKLPSSFKRIKGIYIFYNGYSYSCNSNSNTFKELGYEFYDLEIDYSFEENKTISFKPIIGENFEVRGFLWLFGDESNSTEENPTHRYLEYGDYNVTLIVGYEPDRPNGKYSTSKLVTIKPRVMKLQKGWNLMTPPTKKDMNVTLFDESWYFEDGFWINDVEFLTPSIGYWVKAYSDLNLSFDNTHYPLVQSKLKNGWSLVGSGEKIGNFDKNLTYFIYRNGEWIENPKEIEVGEGVWIKNGEYSYKEEFANFLNENSEYFYLKDNIYVKKVTKNDLNNITTIGFTNMFNYYNGENIDIEYLFQKLLYTPNLETFNLYSSKIKELPKELLNLKNLKRLHLSNTNITTISEDIKKLKNLERLSIQGSIKEIPNEIGDLTKLKELSFYGNQIEVLPNVFDKLVNLYSLNLSGNKIEILPSSIGELKNLKDLSLYGNPLKVFPKSLYNLKNLESLFLDSLQIEKFSNEIEGLPYLRIDYYR